MMEDPPFVGGKQIKVTAVGCFTDFCFAIGTEGELFTWGCGAHGRLGRGVHVVQDHDRARAGLAACAELN